MNEICELEYRTSEKGGPVNSWGTMLMVPEKGHTRSAAFYVEVPYDLKERPTVSVTVYSPDSVGTTFAVYNIKMNRIGGQTQFAVEAQNVIAPIVGAEGGSSDLKFYCSIMVIGKT